MPLQNFMQLPWPLYNSFIKHHQGRVLMREPCVFHLNMLNHIFFLSHEIDFLCLYIRPELSETARAIWRNIARELHVL